MPAMTTRPRESAIGWRWAAIMVLAATLAWLGDWRWSSSTSPAAASSWATPEEKLTRRRVRRALPSMRFEANRQSSSPPRTRGRASATSGAGAPSRAPTGAIPTVVELVVQVSALDAQAFCLARPAPPRRNGSSRPAAGRVDAVNTCSSAPGIRGPVSRPPLIKTWDFPHPADEIMPSRSERPRFAA